MGSDIVPTGNAKYIVLDKRILCYSVKHHDKKTDVATLKIFKNPDDFRKDVLLQEVDIDNWSSYFPAK